MLDIDRLLKVALGELKGRGVGKTTLACSQVVGTLQTTDDGIIYCTVKLIKHIGYMKDMLVRILEDYDYRVVEQRRSDFSMKLNNGRVIQFIRGDEYKMEGLRGWRVEFDDSEG